MKLKSPISYLFFFLISASALASNNGGGGFKLAEKEDPHIKRSDFPPGFLFGAASSAYQVEGAYLEDGKSLNNWDVFCHSVGCGVNGENGDIADDHYHHFMEDIELMHSLGLKVYRFSISWARILPRGRFGKVNPAGIMFYNKIIDNLILKGIEPFVTLFHGDFPYELQERYGSWLSPEMKKDFVHMANICFKSFGDRVKYWVTINEPNLVTQFSYETGIFPPSRCSEPYGNCLAGNSDVEPLRVMHNMLLAHGMAVKLYRGKYQSKQGGSIGIAVHCDMFEPLTDSELDRNAAKRAFAFNIGCDEGFKGSCKQPVDVRVEANDYHDDIEDSIGLSQEYHYENSLTEDEFDDDSFEDDDGSSDDEGSSDDDDDYYGGYVICISCFL